MTTIKRSASKAGVQRAAQVVGAVFLLVGILWLYGLFVDHDSAANFVPVNNADNWLHLILGLGMVALGVVLGRQHGHPGPVTDH